MNDSINYVITTIEKSFNNSIELINKVDSFYNSAWDKLIVVCSIAFGIVGILVPLIIQWYQKRTLKINKRQLKSDIELQVSEIKSEILVEINNILLDKMLDFEQKIEKLEAAANAKAYHLQGNIQLDRNLIQGALSDFCIAAKENLKAENYRNLQIVIELISEKCIPKLSLEELSDLKISKSCDLDLILNEISEADEKQIFINTIRNIKLKISKLPKTIKDKEDNE